MATRKTLRKPINEEPIDLTEFGPVSYPLGDGEDLVHNLAFALEYVHENVRGVKPGTKFHVIQSVIVYPPGESEDEEEDVYDHPMRDDTNVIEQTFQELQDRWRMWHGGNTFDPVRDPEFIRYHKDVSLVHPTIWH